MTLATLGLAIDSSQAAKASSDLDQLVVSAKGAAKAADDLTAATKPAAQATADLSKAAKPAADAVAGLNTAASAGASTVTAHAAATTHAATAHAGLSTQAMAASHSIRSTVEMLAMGIPPTQALASQMNHLSYAASGPGGLKGAFSEAIGMFGRMLTPMSVLGGAALGAGVAALYLANSWSESGVQVQRALIGIGAATGATVADIHNFVKANSSAAGLTVGEAQNAAIEFTKTGNIAVQGLKGVGDAIHGYAILTGKDATDATKVLAEALSGDLVKAAEQIDRTYGSMNSSTLDYIRTLEIQGDRSKAIQVIFDAIRPANQEAAASVGVLTKAYQSLAGVMSRLKNGPGVSTESPQDQLAALQAQRGTAAQSGTTVGRNNNGEFVQFANNAELLANLDQKIKDLQAEASKFNSSHITTQLNEMSKAGNGVVKSIVPQIDQIDTLKKSLETLRAANNTPGAAAPAHSDAADRALVVNIRLLQDQVDATDHMNAKTLEIADNYKGYSIEVAKTLDAQKGQLSIAQAVTVQERLAAQEAEQRRRLEIDQGIKPDQGGSAIAANARANAEAQIRAQIEGQLLGMRDQLAVAQAVTGQQQLTAQVDATRNQLIREGVDGALAAQAADMQREIAEARISSQIQNQVSALDDETRMIYATARGAGAAEAAAISYERAMRAGATATDAAALSAATLAANTAKASAAAYEASQRMHNASGGPQEFGNQWGNQEVGLPGTGGTDEQIAMWKANYGPGGYSTYIAGGSGGNFHFGIVDAMPNDQGYQYMYAQTLKGAAEKNMDAVTRAKFEAGAYRLPQAQAQAISDAFLQQGSNATNVNAQKAASDFVGSADSSSSSSTNNSLINALYTSGSSSVIGFHAANGIDFTVPGSGPTDSIRVDGRVTPGERLIVVPPGGSPPADMQGAARARSNFIQRIVIQAASMRGASDTMPQLAARAARAAAAAARHR